ncbi:family 16 glycosylhydrolase [Pseudarcicella hirudinis]|uniref:glycoside hydrolase family 16 protein n=1 Tax=Pseudarcicella hirudinis TaxID=1079859 RepID=UPI0035EE68DD
MKNIKRKLVWSDEFNYKGLPDSTKWGYEVGHVRNNEPQHYTRKRLENCRVEDGLLVIEARKEKFDTSAYTSASIMTLGKKTWTYGRFEVRAKVPKGLGVWSAFWMLGENRQAVKWPTCGEIDIMEFVGKDSSQVYGTIHYADSTGTYKYHGEKPVVGAPYDDFHIYAIEWTKDQIDFYYDELKYFSFDLKKSKKGNENTFQKKFYLLLNLALGREGTLGGKLDKSIVSSKYFVDYVRVYQ